MAPVDMQDQNVTDAWKAFISPLKQEQGKASKRTITSPMTRIMNAKQNPNNTVDVHKQTAARTDKACISSPYELHQ